MTDRGVGSYMQSAISHVHDFVNGQLDKSDPPAEFDVYVVWFCKTLQNWKALVSTSLPDQMYYEVTFNGDTGETYLDAYKKFQNLCISEKVSA